MLGASIAHIAFRRDIVRGLIQLVRDRSWGTTLLLLTLLLLLMQLLTVFLLFADGANRFLVNRAALHVEILPTASQQQIQELYAALKEQTYVEEASFVTKEQALELEKHRDPELAAFLEEYTLDNPFPDTFAVTLTTLGSYDAFNTFIQQEQWRDIVNPSYLSSVTDQERSVRMLLQVTGAVRLLVVFFIAVGFALLCFVILEWVIRNIARRKDELVLEQVLGAQPVNMLLPLVTEMSVFLLAAHLIAISAVVLLLFALPFAIPAIALEEPFMELKQQVVPLLTTVLPALFGAQLLLLPILAFGGTWIGARTLRT